MIRRLAIGLVLGAALFASAVPSSSAAVRYVTQWGSGGDGPGQFGGPNDLAATPSGTIFVSDLFGSLAPRVQEFTSQGEFVRIWGTGYGILPGQFLSPGGIATSPSGSIYVGDYAQNRIQRFGPDGVFQGEWGSTGPSKGRFASPWGVATDPSGRVYVVDYGNNRVQKFTADGTYLDQWGSFGSGDGQFLSPSFVATDSDGHVYVADSGNSRIQKFTARGRYLDQWPTPGPGAGPSDYPLGIATSPEGDVYVVGSNSIQKYSPDGSLLTRWGEFGRGDGQFRNPQGIAADSMGNVYVGDSGNDRIQKFHDPGPPYPDPGTARLKMTAPPIPPVRGGRVATIVVPVRNTGSNPAKRVRVCAGSGRCVGLGSIANGHGKVARFRIGTSCRRPGVLPVRLRATAGNAPAISGRTTVRVKRCPQRIRPPFPWEGLG